MTDPSMGMFMRCQVKGYVIDYRTKRSVSVSRRLCQWILIAIHPSEILVMFRGHVSQPLRRTLRGDVALRHAQQLEADHELLHRRGAEQRGIEVPMEVVRLLRALMKAHGVGKTR